VTVKANGSAPSAAGVMTSTVRCLQLLDAMAQDPYTFTLTGIATLLSVPKSSAHRLLSTLIAAGLVERDTARERYQLAGKVLWLGTAYLRNSDVYRAGFAVVDDLARRAKAMSHLAVWDNDAVLYLGTMGAPRSLNLFADTGERRTVHATALGKAMLAYRPDADLQRIISSGCAQFTGRTITTLRGLRKEVDRIRALGYALDDEEGVPGLRCVAAPIRDRRAQVVAAISVSAPCSQITNEELPRFARLVEEAAIRVSVHLGYRPPTSNLSSLLTPRTSTESRV
jgi:IclR family acetate operon transcriptional repressor